MDVTGSLAQQDDSAGWTWSRFIAAGGAFIWPLFFIAGIGVILIIERAVTLMMLRTPRQVAVLTLDAVVQGDVAAAQALVADARTPLARVLAAGLEAWQRGRDAVEAALQAPWCTRSCAWVVLCGFWQCWLPRRLAGAFGHSQRHDWYL